MVKPKVICWDLDDTLGLFKSIQYELEGREYIDDEKPISLRYGIKDLLSNLSDQGYLHFVTTSGTFEYAQEALTRTGLIYYFEGIYGRDTISTDFFSKNYEPVAKQIGFSDEEAISNMIVIGDAPGDKPGDLEGLVFIMQNMCYLTDSYVTAKILETLDELGNGDFNKGFEQMYLNPTSEEFDEKIYDIDDIQLVLDYTSKGAANEDKVVPRIRIIESEKYMKKPTIVV